MTKEEAIKNLKYFSLCGAYHQLIHMNDTDSEAITMAIKALEQPEIIRCEECMYRNNTGASVCWLPCMKAATGDYWFCGSGKRAERREDD